jgi:hypothetical protein
VKFLLRFAAWATLAFLFAWVVHPFWQHVIAAIGAKLAAPRGTSIEIEDLELFYPFDVGVFVGLCLASSWTTPRRRIRAAAIGIPLLVAAEVLTVVVAFRVLMHPPDQAQALRFVDGIVRVSGLVVALVVWLYLLGREQLSLATGRWLGS